MASEHPNAALARRLWQAISEGDGSALVGELLAPDVVWRSYGDNPLAGEAKGVEASLERLARIGENVDELRTELREVYAGEHGAVIWARTHAERGPKVLDGHLLVHLRIEGGHIVSASVVAMDQRRNDEFWRVE